MDWNELQGESSGLPGADSASSSKAKYVIKSSGYPNFACYVCTIIIFEPLQDVSLFSNRAWGNCACSRYFYLLFCI